MRSNSKIPYRPEIDGLRAVAVLAVILFHAKCGLPGGFAGVDVFFVISGYLITGLIAQDLDHGTFRLQEFWERRIRRILPPLVVVTVVAFAGSWFLLLPGDFKQFGGSLAALSSLVSNVFFWFTGGYFGRPADVKPLLHTWSLAVEEQFYLLFPLLLLLAGRSLRRRRLAIGVLLTASFFLSAHFTNIRPRPSFYWLPTRAWELLLGGMIVDLRRPLGFPRWLAEWISWCGLGAIVCSFFVYNEITPFPGMAALMPCLGAAFLIWSTNAGQTSLGKILSSRPIVFVGLISYSLYLWHWPLLVFVNYWDFSADCGLHRALAVGLAVVLSILSWQLIERPFREKRVFRTKRSIYALAAGSSLVFLVAGSAVYSREGVSSRFSHVCLSYANTSFEQEFFSEVSLKQAQEGHFINFGSAAHPAGDLLVWGDSHAMALLPVLDALGKEFGARGLGAVHSSTAPLVGISSSTGRRSLGKDSIPFARAVTAYVKSNQIRHVVLAAAWSTYTKTNSIPNRGEFVIQMRETVRQLVEAGAKVWIVKDVPTHPYDIPKALAARCLFGKPEQIGVTMNSHLQVVSEFDEILDAAIGTSAARLDPTPYFALAGGHCLVEKNGASLYRDFSHLSVNGSKALRPLFEPLFEQISHTIKFYRSPETIRSDR